jgi:uncharacterized membrane protein (UPF0136 family)
MGVLCFVGGAAGYARTRSIPSMVAGLALGSMFTLSGLRIKEGMSYGYEGAAGKYSMFRKMINTVHRVCFDHQVLPVFSLEPCCRECPNSHGLTT